MMAARKRATRRHVVVIVSDLHCGSTVGLHPPDDTVLDDGGTYTPSKAQGWLWEHWSAFWERALKLADGADLHIICNGDAVDGDHHGTAQIVSRDGNVQFDILRRCWEPILSLRRPTSFVVVRGTEVHVGKSGNVEEGFAGWLQGKGVVVPIVPGSRNRSHWHWRGDYGGTVIDATHHGRMGTRPWTKLSGVGTLAAQIVMEAAMRGETPPHLALRSHYHQHTDTADNFPTRVIQTPAWQLATAFVHRIAPESLADVGGVIVSIEGGRYDVEKYLAKPDPTPTWKAA